MMWLIIIVAFITTIIIYEPLVDVTSEGEFIIWYNKKENRTYYKTGIYKRYDKKKEEKD